MALAVHDRLRLSARSKMSLAMAFIERALSRKRQFGSRIEIHQIILSYRHTNFDGKIAWGIYYHNQKECKPETTAENRMRICKVQLAAGATMAGWIDGNVVRL